MDSHDIDWERLDRYVSGRGTPEELEALRRWVESDPDLRALTQAMRTAGRQPGTGTGAGAGAGAGAEPGAWDARAAWQRLRPLMRRVDRAPLQMARAGELGRPAWRRGWAWATAAAVVLAVGGSVLAERAGWLARGSVEAPPMREVVTRRGQRAALNLADGSRVTLAAASRLRIPDTYRTTTGARDLYLEGEAYFEVQHDSARPFRVHAANGIAEDLGTEFVVSAHPETRGIEVVVALGVVALRTTDTLRAQPRALLTLTRGDLGRLDSAGTATLTRNVNVAAYMGWVEGTLVFDGTPLREVVPTLARWYDLDIRIADSALAERRLTATVRNQTAEQVLDLVALSLGLRVERNGSAVVLESVRSGR